MHMSVSVLFVDCCAGVGVSVGDVVIVVVVVVVAAAAAAAFVVVVAMVIVMVMVLVVVVVVRINAEPDSCVANRQRLESLSCISIMLPELESRFQNPQSESNSQGLMQIRPKSSSGLTSSQELIQRMHMF